MEGPCHGHSKSCFQGNLTMRVLDLFCGMGGWSIGFHRAGFECVGVDITDWGYPYEFIQSDIKAIQEPLGHFDVVVASPPCEWYSQARNDRPRETGKGDELVGETTRVIKIHNPKFWILENVRGSIPHITRVLGSGPVYRRGPQFLWGDFPKTLIDDRSFRKLGFFDRNTTSGRMREDYIKLRKSIRSIVPLGISYPIAQAISSYLPEETEAMMRVEKASCGCKAVIWDRKDGRQTIKRYFCRQHGRLKP